MPITAFISKASFNHQLVTAIAEMYTTSQTEHPDNRAQGWCEQLLAVMDWHGQPVVIETLVDVVPALSLRQAMAVVWCARSSLVGNRR